MATKINYNDYMIATIQAGQTATFICEGEKMASNIVVEFDTAGTITYNGEETAVQAGQTATLNCIGKKAVSDIVIVANATQGGNTGTLISFTIYGTEYQAEEGMTWEQWCDSSYNTDGYYVNWANGYIYNSSGDKIIYGENFTNFVMPYDYTVSSEVGGMPDPF